MDRNMRLVPILVAALAAACTPKEADDDGVQMIPEIDAGSGGMGGMMVPDPVDLATCAGICDAASAMNGVDAAEAQCWRGAISALAPAIAECNLSGEGCAECLSTNEVTDAQCAAEITTCQMSGPMVTDDFGQDCYLPDGCDSDSAAWPDCIDSQCETGDCNFPVFTLDYGFCTRECTEEYECENAAATGTYGTEFTCNTDGTSGVCAPGSNRRCDYNNNGQCDIEGETCKFVLLFAPDNTYGGACQPETPEAGEVGDSCDEEEGVFCKNDMCLYNVCTSICDPEAEQSPCPTNFACFEDWTPFSNPNITIDMCLPQYCEVDAECPADAICTLGFDFNASNVLRGICVPFQEGRARAGEECNDDTPCAAAACFDGYCGGLCNDDGDCPNDDYCSIVNFRINAEPGSAPAQVCQPGTGSGRACAINSDCAADPENGADADEACAYVVRGELEGGLPLGDLTVSGRCTTIPTGAVGFGEQCGQLAPCTNEDLCLSAGTNFCAEPCRSTADCADGAICFGLGITADIEGGVCVPGERLGIPGSSLTECRNDAECGEGEHCRLNVIGSSDPVAERLCAADEGEGDLASACDGDDNCKSGTCFPRSTDLMQPGYCFGPCAVDADCGEGFGCALQVMHATSGVRAKVCRPLDVCGPCALDGTLVCAGGLICTALNYEGVGMGAACLSPCEGAEDEACGTGNTCVQRVGPGGEILEGEYTCTPESPATTCGDAMPR